MRKYPVGMVLGGYYNGTTGGLYNQNMDGIYWSSMTDSSTGLSYRLRLNNVTVNPIDSGPKWFGYSLRCLAQNQTKNKKPSRLNKKQNKKNRTKVVPKSILPPNRWPFWRIPNSLQ